MKPQKLVDLIIYGTKTKKICLHHGFFGEIVHKAQIYGELLFIYAVRSILLALGLCILFLVAQHYFPKYKIIEREVINDTLALKIEELKSAIIDDIKKGETSNAPESAGVIIFDTNKRASIGSYQFQIRTVQHYYKKFYSKDITQKEAILIALDDTQARLLARDIVFREKAGYENWYNTSKKYNIASRVALVNNLTNK